MEAARSSSETETVGRESQGANAIVPAVEAAYGGAAITGASGNTSGRKRGGVVVTREELAKFIEQECERIKELFDQKNLAYGKHEDAFYNFVEAARRVLYSIDLGDALKVLLIYMQKHLIALENRGAFDKEAIERFRDIAVYALIGAAMVKAIRKGLPDCRL